MHECNGAIAMKVVLCLHQLGMLLEYLNSAGFVIATSLLVYVFMMRRKMSCRKVTRALRGGQSAADRQRKKQVNKAKSRDQFKGKLETKRKDRERRKAVERKNLIDQMSNEEKVIYFEREKEHARLIEVSEAHVRDDDDIVCNLTWTLSC